MSIVFAVWGFK